MTSLRYATYAVLAFAVLVIVVGLARMLAARKRHGCAYCGGVDGKHLRGCGGGKGGVPF